MLMTTASFRSNEPWMFVPDQSSWPSAIPTTKSDSAPSWTSIPENSTSKWGQTWSSTWDPPVTPSKTEKVIAKPTSAPIEEKLVLKFDELSVLNSADFEVHAITQVKKSPKKKVVAPIAAPVSAPAPIPAPIPAVEPITTPIPPVDDKNNIEDELAKQSLYKTELCRSYQETGTCRYGHKCQFAHGQHELRPILRHPKYKTENCKTFVTTGICPYGNRCRFIHPPPTTTTNPSVASSNVEWSTSWNQSSSVKKNTKKISTSNEEEEQAKRLSFFKRLAS